MESRIGIPSKTFLSGEYAVMYGGRALVLCTKPKFQVELSATLNTQVEGIAPNSPAGQWIRENRTSFQNIRMRFDDPHQGRGGFGASGAQFLGAYICAQILEHGAMEWEKLLDPKKVLLAYRQFVEPKIGSGSDLLAMMSGGVTVLESVPQVTHRSEAWPFEDVDFALVRTGFKVKTHEHLQNLELSTSAKEKLRLASRELERFFSDNNLASFIEGLNSYNELLVSLGLQLASTSDLIAEIKNGVQPLAIKGCGAQGADTILILFEESQRERVKDRLASLNLEAIAFKSDLSKAASIEHRTDSLKTFNPKTGDINV